MYFMKKFSKILILLFFCLQCIAKADEIKGFEIEGMSIGDSMLDYMDEDKIINEMNSKDYSFFYDDDYVTISTWNIRDKFKIYNDVGVILKFGDNQYKIYGLEGTLYMEEDSYIEECYKKQNEIVDDIKNLLNLDNKGDTWFVDKNNLAEEFLSIKYTDFELNGGGVIRVVCSEIKKGVKKFNDRNLLNVIINSSTFYKFLFNRS